MSRVRDVMHVRVARIQSNANLVELIRLLVREAVSAVPVVEPGCRLVGVAAVSDVLASIAHLLETNANDSLESVLTNLHVRDIMTPTALTVGPDVLVSHAARTIHDARVHSVFVVDHDRLCGVVSAFDLLRTVAQAG